MTLFIKAMTANILDVFPTKLALFPNNSPRPETTESPSRPDYRNYGILDTRERRQAGYRHLHKLR